MEMGTNVGSVGKVDDFGVGVNRLGSDSPVRVALGSMLNQATEVGRKAVET